MKYVVLTLLGFLGLILQATVFNELIIAGVKPDILLIIVLLYALFNGPRQGAFMGFGLGLLEDIFQAKYFGLNAASKLISGFIYGFLEKSTFKDNLLVPVLVLFSGSLVHISIYFVFSNIVGYHLTLENMIRVALPFAIYNTCFSPFVYGSFYKASTRGVLKRTTSV